MVVMNIPGRAEWVPGLQKVEQDMPDVFIGSIHHCKFEEYESILSPLRMTLSNEGILYAERCEVKEMNISLVHEFVFTKINEKACMFACRSLNAGESPLPEKISAAFFKNMQQMAEKLKSYCEVMDKSFF